MGYSNSSRAESSKRSGKGRAQGQNSQWYQGQAKGSGKDRSAQSPAPKTHPWNKWSHEASNNYAPAASQEESSEDAIVDSDPDDWQRRKDLNWEVQMVKQNIAAIRGRDDPYAEKNRAGLKVELRKLMAQITCLKPLSEQKAVHSKRILDLQGMLQDAKDAVSAAEMHVQEVTAQLEEAESDLERTRQALEDEAELAEALDAGDLSTISSGPSLARTTSSISSVDAKRVEALESQILQMSAQQQQMTASMQQFMQMMSASMPAAAAGFPAAQAGALPQIQGPPFQAGPQDSSFATPSHRGPPSSQPRSVSPTQIIQRPVPPAASPSGPMVHDLTHNESDAEEFSDPMEEGAEAQASSKKGKGVLNRITKRQPPAVVIKTEVSDDKKAAEK